MEEVLDREARRDYQNNAIKIFKFGLSVILIYLLAFGFMFFAMQTRSGLEGFLGMLVLIGCFVGVVVPFIYTGFAIQALGRFVTFRKKFLKLDKYLIMGCVGITLCLLPMLVLICVLLVF